MPSQLNEMSEVNREHLMQLHTSLQDVHKVLKVCPKCCGQAMHTECKKCAE